MPIDLCFGCASIIEYHRQALKQDIRAKPLISIRILTRLYCDEIESIRLLRFKLVVFETFRRPPPPPAVVT